MKKLKLKQVKCFCGCKKVIGKVFNTIIKYYALGHEPKGYYNKQYTHIVINYKASFKYHQSKV